MFAALMLLSACSVKNYPIGRPFVYEANVHVQDDSLKRDDRNDLETRLRQQLHDSINVRRVSKAFVISQLRNPPVYDSANADKSIGYIDALMHSLGYYRDTAWYTADTVRKGDQLRTTLDFYVTPGKLTLIDSISIALNDTTLNSPRQAAALDSLQQITLRNQAASPIRKGAPFAKPLLSSELDRLVGIYHNNGFLRFSREQMTIVFDTVGIALLRPTFDPLEQARLLEALQRRRDNPVADIEYRLRPIADTGVLVRYHIGTITVYPDLTLENAKLPSPTTVLDTSGIYIRSYQDLFKHRVLTSNVYFRRGQLYDQRVIDRTATRFNSLAAWRIASVDPIPRAGTDSVDMVIRLTPAEKYHFDIGLEGSQNLGGLFVGSNLVGINANLQNRNFARRAIQATYSAGVATEINSTVTQTMQVSGAASFVFPRLIFPANLVIFRKFPILPIPVRNPYRTSQRTSLALATRYIHRIDYLDLLSMNASWGYEGSRNNRIGSVRIPNIEYTSVRRFAILDTLIKNNRSYQFLFNDGLIISSLWNWTGTWASTRSTHVLRGSLEPAGLLISQINSKFLDENLKRFIKLDLTWQYNRKLGNNRVLATRALFGIGYSMPFSNTDSTRFYLPFYRAYYAGGANSMRGWTLRKLGPGSSIQSFARDVSPERFGDMQLEGNVEYRFQVANVRGVFINSALYSDIGNVWYLRENPAFPNGEFRLSRLWHDIAIDVGTGVRIDFGFLKFRVDYAFKMKDPSPADPLAQNKLFYKFDVLKGTVQLGVDYPF
ncbi:BamA/TamA family outer membrane protein [Flaviaesturariibacter terrae]